MKSKMHCEPELLLFAGMNDHLHAAGLLEQLKGYEPMPKKIWEAIKTLFAAMNEVQENVSSRFGPKTRVVFTTSPGYANMPPALQFVYAILSRIAEGNAWRILMGAPNRELEPSNLRLRKSELAAAWADVSHVLEGFYELADILIVLDEVLLFEISNLARQLKFSPVIGNDHPIISHLTASLWFRGIDLPVTVPEFPTVRRMTLGMNSSLVVPSLFARATVEKQQKEFTDVWDPLFIGYTAAVYFHTCDIKINSWATQTKKKMRGSMPPKFEVRDILRTLDQANLENMLPVWDDGRMIVEEGHIALKDEMKFATRKYRAPYGLEQVEMKQEGKELDAAGLLYVALTEYRKQDPAAPSPLSVVTPGDKRSGSVEDR